MNGNQAKKNNLLDTTDCLEAVGVFRGWKNVLFVIVALCLLLLQVSFWLVDRGFIKACDEPKSGTAVVAGDEIKEAAEKAAEPNKPAEVAPKKPQQSAEAGSLFGITLKRLSSFIRFANGVLILTAALYCLTMLFSLKISLIGRLGGINHISRAFLLSLIMVVLLLPWQSVFGGVVLGAIYTPCELVKRCAAEKSDIFTTTFHYLRFTGYWLVVMLLLVFSQLRSSRWTRTILRRLEVI